MKNSDWILPKPTSPLSVELLPLPSLINPTPLPLLLLLTLKSHHRNLISHQSCIYHSLMYQPPFSTPLFRYILWPPPIFIKRSGTMLKYIPHTLLFLWGLMVEFSLKYGEIIFLTTFTISFQQQCTIFRTLILSVSTKIQHGSN